MKSNKHIVFTILVIGLMLFISLIFQTNSSDKIPPHGGLNRSYYFRVELRQWEITIFDLNQVEDLILGGMSTQKAFEMSKYSDRMINLEKLSSVHFQIYSLDIQHGFSIPEMDISIAITKVTENIDSELPTYLDVTLPRKDTNITIKCQTYCGMGHSNMQFQIGIGDGEKTYGMEILKFFIYLLGGIAIYFGNLILKEIPRKGYVHYDKSINAYVLYDISGLSSKNLISLRHDPSSVAKLGTRIRCLNIDSKMMASNELKNKYPNENWKLI